MVATEFNFRRVKEVTVLSSFKLQIYLIFLGANIMASSSFAESPLDLYNDANIVSVEYFHNNVYNV